VSSLKSGTQVEGVVFIKDGVYLHIDFFCSKKSLLPPKLSARLIQFNCAKLQLMTCSVYQPESNQLQDSFSLTRSSMKPYGAPQSMKQDEGLVINANFNKPNCQDGSIAVT
jgi:hypothetical protein